MYINIAIRLVYQVRTHVHSVYTSRAAITYNRIAMDCNTGTRSKDCRHCRPASYISHSTIRRFPRTLALEQPYNSPFTNPFQDNRVCFFRFVRAVPSLAVVFA